MKKFRRSPHCHLSPANNHWGSWGVWGAHTKLQKFCIGVLSKDRRNLCHEYFPNIQYVYSSCMFKMQVSVGWCILLGLLGALSSSSLAASSLCCFSFLDGLLIFLNFCLNCSFQDPYMYVDRTYYIPSNILALNFLCWGLHQYMLPAYRCTSLKQLYTVTTPACKLSINSLVVAISHTVCHAKNCHEGNKKLERGISMNLL